MKNFVSLGLIALVTTACTSFDGDLIVKEPMKVIKREGLFHLGKKEVELQAATYKASLEVVSETNFRLKLSDKTSIPLKLKETKDFQLEGDIHIDHSEIDQPFDIQGHVETQISNSFPSTRTESCSVTRNVYVCRTVKKENRDIRECGNETQTISGSREATYQTVTENRDVILNFLEANSAHVLGTFKGITSDSKEIRMSEGQCMIFDRF